MVAPFASTVPPFVAANAIRDGARDYFRSVHAHTGEVTITILAGSDRAIVEPDSDETEILAISEVKFNDFNVLRKVQSIGCEISGPPSAYMGIGNSTIRVSPIPKVDTNLIVKLALRPTFAATEIEDEILLNNEEGIRYAALVRLKRQPSTEWHSPSEVEYYSSLFNQEVGQKRIEMLNGGLDGNLTMKIASFM
tara:strand:- start:168002 stop:168583 length:582 start_codon:yes stop_codon:yes gene_type:complete